MTSKHDHLIGCIIDGAIPHSDEERCQILAALLEELNGECDTNEDCYDDRQDYLDDLEYRLTTAIEEALPTPLCLILEAGDVIITTIDQRDA